MDGQEKDVTLDLPLNKDQASALYVILDMFIQVHDGLEEQPKPEDIPDGMTQEEFAQINKELIACAKEIKEDVKEIVREQDAPKQEEKPKIYIPKKGESKFF